MKCRFKCPFDTSINAENRLIVLMYGPSIIGLGSPFVQLKNVIRFPKSSKNCEYSFCLFP